MKTNEDRGWLQLVRAAPVRQQQAAFACATGLPLALLPIVPSPDKVRSETIFCIRGCSGENSGRICRQVLSRTEARATQNHKAVVYRCPAGLTRIFVPVLIRNEHLGNLLAGPFALAHLNGARLDRLTARLKDSGVRVDPQRLGAAWQHSPILTQKRCRAITTLVCLFADYLAECGNRLLLHQGDRSSPLMRKIEAFLAAEPNQAITLKIVAEQVNLSPCHFCKVFKKQTGLTFSEYRTRLRVEKVKDLLLSGEVRVSEAAFAAGFNSIPYFNRAFRRYVGCPPSEFRWRGQKANRAKKTTKPA